MHTSLEKNQRARGPARAIPESQPFKLPEDGFYHLAPLGEFEGVLKHDGKETAIIQVLDKAALEKIAAAFDGQLLVDYEHFSHRDDKPSEAVGWLEQVELRTDGLWGKIHWSDKGLGDIRGGSYRFISPEFSAFERIDETRARPLCLCGAGLTNRPNLKTLTPLSNSRREAKPTKNMDYKKYLLVALGLQPDASDEDILAALEHNDEGDSKTIGELRAENARLLEQIVQGDLERFGALIVNRQAAKKLLLKNREDALAFLNSLCAREKAPARVYNRDSARTPEHSPGGHSRAADQDAFVRSLMHRDGLGYNAAWELAKTERPELFRETQNA